MKFGTTISLDSKDMEKLEYIQNACNFESSGKGLTGIIRLVIQKAYAHQKMIDGDDEKQFTQEKIDNSIPKNGKRKMW